MTTENDTPVLPLFHISSDLDESHILHDNVTSCYDAFDCLTHAIHQLQAECNNRQFSKTLHTVLRHIQSSQSSLSSSLPSIFDLANTGLQVHRLKNKLAIANSRASSAETELAVIAGKVNTAIKNKHVAMEKVKMYRERYVIGRWQLLIKSSINLFDQSRVSRSIRDLNRQILQLKGRLEFRIQHSKNSKTTKKPTTRKSKSFGVSSSLSCYNDGDSDNEKSVKL
ncbi:hypothetical protein GEMRC1_007402 [Eukaryota sp. GEM-RC1]